MKKVYIVALATVFAMSAMAASASAEETSTLLAEWLFGGAAVTSTAAISEGILLFEDSKAIAKPAVICEITLEGTVNEDGLDIVSAVLELGTSIKIESLTTQGLLCAAEGGCEASTIASPIEVWPNSKIAAGWETRLVLAPNGTFFDAYFGSGVQFLCLVLGAMIEDECSASETGFPIVNGLGGAQVTSGEKATPVGSCTLGGAASSVIQTFGRFLTESLNRKEITVSSEGAGR